jgi:hypothetical protein
MAALDRPDESFLWLHKLHRFLMDNTEQYVTGTIIGNDIPVNLSRMAKYHVVIPYGAGSVPASGSYTQTVILPDVVVDNEVYTITIPTPYRSTTLIPTITIKTSTGTTILSLPLSSTQPSVSVLKVSPTYSTVPLWVQI